MISLSFEIFFIFVYYETVMFYANCFCICILRLVNNITNLYPCFYY